MEEGREVITKVHTYPNAMREWTGATAKPPDFQLGACEMYNGT